ncbi:MAG: DUF362 domain-containing protein [Planctomycetaceae bacterium]|nr:DUF362 domain-containing protein [Planctomycetaceae bacterium]
MTTVFLERCEHYDNVKTVLAPIWEKIGAADLVAGKKVLLKVNLTKGGPPDLAVATHPAFTAALAELVRESGGEPYVGDSCSIYGFTRETIELAGYGEMSRQTGVPCVPLDSGKVHPVKIGGAHLRDTYLSEYVLDADVIISVPKLKPHDYVEFTGALKNVVGMLPGAIKPYLHYKYSRWEDFLHVVLDLFAHVRPALAFVDGILAMEGQGPTNGTPRQVGLVAASRDPVAVDAVLADLVGLPVVRLLTLAGQRGLGESDLEKIEVVGPPVDDVRVKIQPANPTKAKIGLLGKLKYGVRYYGVRPVLNTESKDALRELARLCPVDAIDLTGRPRIRRNCVRCMTCIESCDNGAVTPKVPRVLHSTYRRKSPGYDLSKMR